MTKNEYIESKLKGFNNEWGAFRNGMKEMLSECWDKAIQTYVESKSITDDEEFY